MPQFLLELSLVRDDMMSGPTEEEMSLVIQHFAFWESVAAKGQALVVGRTQDALPNGYAIFHAEDLGEADKLVQSDPAVGVVFRARVRPYKVAILGDPESFKP